MSLFGKFKQALGFDDNEDDDFYVMSSDENVSSTQEKNNTPILSSNSNESNKVSDVELPLEIFDGVVTLFNESLPDFLKSSVDTEAQRKYIYDTLSADTKKYLDRLAREARSVNDGKWKDERTRMQNEMLQLKEQCRAVDEQRSEWQKQQLSAERQKRALSERVHDLEKQVATLEAEKEQYDLENKSLLNKLKVSAVVDGDMAQMRQEIAQLHAQLDEARAAAKTPGDNDLADDENLLIAQKDTEIAALKEQLALANSQGNDYDEIETLKQEIAYLSEQNSNLQEAVISLTEKEKTSDVQIQELNAKIQAANKQLDEKQALLDAIPSQSDADKNEINLLNDKLKFANSQLEEMNAELEQSREAIAALDEIQEQIEKFEEFKEKKNARIADLKNQLNDQKVRVSELEEENESLKKTIETNLYAQAELEQELRREIDALKPSNKNTDLEINADVIGDTADSLPKRPVISAIDDSSDDTVWLVATPPPGTTIKPEPSSADDEFGYKSPTRKPTVPENDAQMSLF